MSYSSPSFSSACGVLLAGTLMITTHVHAQRSSYQFEDRQDGGIIVSFPSGCKIAYDGQAKRGGHSGKCDQAENNSADKAAANYLGVGSSRNSVSQAQMQRYCKGEAAGFLDLRPTDISTSPVERINRGRFAVRGKTAPRGSNFKEFKCTFDRDGVFEQVRVTNTSDNYRAPSHSGSQQGNIPHAARSSCLQMFGGGSSSRVSNVSALRPGYWEVILNNETSARSVACTVTNDGKIEEWVELN